MILPLALRQDEVELHPVLLQSADFTEPVLSIVVKLCMVLRLTQESACVDSPSSMTHIRCRITNRYGQCIPGSWIFSLFSVHDLTLRLVISRYRSMHHKEQHQRLRIPITQGNHL
jgi:hypothetical protein